MNADNRSLALVAGGVVAVAVIAVVVVLATSGREPTSYPESTPQGVVQRYLLAHDAGDVAAAHAYFSASVREAVDLETYRTMFIGDEYPAPPSAVRRVLFDGTTERGGDPETVVVRLTVEEVYGQGIEGEISRNVYEVPMILEPDGWRIDELLVWLYPAAAPERPAP
jgi:hypothetical protein